MDFETKDIFYNESKIEELFEILSSQMKKIGCGDVGKSRAQSCNYLFHLLSK